MTQSMTTFWNDESGFVISAELILVATILVLGLIVGLSSLQTALVYELNNLAWAFGSLNQSYFVPGFFGCKGTFKYGSSFFNNVNFGTCFVAPMGAWGTNGLGVGYGGYGMGGYGMGGMGGYGGATFGVGSSPMSRPATIVAPAAPASVCPTHQTAPCPADCPQQPVETQTPAGSQQPASAPLTIDTPNSLAAPGPALPAVGR